MARWRQRRFWALLANTAYALSSFVLGYLLLLQGDNQLYGAFAFYLLIQAFAYSLINALFGAPLLIASRDGRTAAAGLNPMLRLASLLALFCGLLQALLLRQQGIQHDVTYLLAISSVLLQLRWFCRCVQQNDDPDRVMLSDGFFSLITLLGAAWLMLHETVSLWSLSWLLLIATVTSLFPAGRLLWTLMRAQPDWRLWSKGFEQQGKPALTGVVTAEATANTHQYLIVLLLGPAALAPVAAAGLFLRPMTLVQSSLAQIDRPRLARAAAVADWFELQQVWRSSVRLSLLAFVLNLFVLVWLLWLVPAILWPDLTTLPDFIVCGSFVVVVALLRSLRGPASTMLQAFDQFQLLADITWRASLCTLPLVLLGILVAGTYGALTAMVLGECLVAIPTLQRCRQMLMSETMQR